ncbi:hypothetical protein REPUB_Repub04eG0148500 [Reevesia pubescens]
MVKQNIIVGADATVHLAYGRADKATGGGIDAAVDTRTMEQRIQLQIKKTDAAANEGATPNSHTTFGARPSIPPTSTQSARWTTEDANHADDDDAIDMDYH